MNLTLDNIQTSDLNDDFYPALDSPTTAVKGQQDRFANLVKMEKKAQ
jgi:hypothetical protein